MKRVVIWSETEVRHLICPRIQKKFPGIIVTSENELTRAIWLMEKRPTDAMEFEKHFINADIAADKLDDFYFFAIVDNKLTRLQERMFTVLTDVWGDNSHWRYFIVDSECNLDKMIRNVLNFDVGLPISRIHLPGESYEWTL